jgi:Na+-driven multidrug efflux pump
MAARTQMTPAGMRLTAVALAIGGVMLIVMAVLFFYLGMPIAEISPGFDLIWVLFPALAIFDWIMAFYFWRKGSAPAPNDGPVVG